VQFLQCADILIRTKKNNKISVLKQIIIVTACVWSIVGSAATMQNYANSPYIAPNKAQIAIIIDDIGNKKADIAAFALPKEVTFSILPHTDFSTSFSTWASNQGREVMLHMPMESLNGEALGTGAILSNMYPDEVANALNAALASVPHAVGVNNHMGSKLTQLTLQLNSIMQVLHNNDLFFIDSRTTRFTKAHLIAQRSGVVSAQRHIFLDHYPREDFLQKQLDSLIRRARQKGKALGIAHPYPVTIEFLNYALSNLPADVELITVAAYLNQVNKGYDRLKFAKVTEQQSFTSAPN